MQMCTYVCMYVCMYVNMYASMLAGTCVCICVYNLSTLKNSSAHGETVFLCLVGWLV